MAVGLVSSAVLARNLDAADYGVVGVAMIVIGLLGRFSDIGVGPAIIQREELDAGILRTAQTLNLALAAILFTCALVAAPFTPLIFKSGAVPAVVCVLACSFLFDAIGFLPSSMLTRELRFGTLRFPAVAGALVKGIVAVICAIKGLRYWSLVIGTIAGTVTTAALLRSARPISVGFGLDRSRVKELLNFGIPLTITGLLIFVVFNVDNFVIGSLLGTAALGLYTVAFTWSTLVCTTLSDTLHSVLFPKFSQMRHERSEIALMYYRSLRAVMFGSFLGNAALFVVGEGFLVTILGKGNPRWLPALGTLQILCVYGTMRASMEPVANVIMALGRTKLVLRAVAVAAAVEVGLLPITARAFGLPGVAWLVCGAYMLQWVVYAPFLKREIGVGPGKLIRAVIPALLGAVAAIAVARWIRINDPIGWGTIVLRSALVIAVFTIIHEGLTKGAMLREVRLVLRSRLWSAARVPLPVQVSE
jgi:O-antigen/teichoic acid export membrane protein